MRIKPFIGSLALALGAFVIALPINLLTDVSSLTWVFLVAILISAISFGLWPSLFASLISVLLYDFFFLPPIYSLSVASTDDLINLVTFFLVAAIVSALAARVRRYAIAADERAITAERLSSFCRSLADAVTIQQVLERAAQMTASLTGLPVTLVLPGVETQTVGYPLGVVPDTATIEAATAVWDRLPPDHDHSQKLKGRWRSMVLGTARTAIGVALIRQPMAAADWTAAQERLLAALLDQTAAAIERVRLQLHLEHARVEAQTQEFRSTLLTSMSHDLRSPLSGVIAAASTLERQWTAFDDATKLDIVQTLRIDAERLNALIRDLLDMARIEANAMQLHIEVASIQEAVGAALNQISQVRTEHRLNIDVPDTLPLVQADAVLLNQVLCNLIDNAAKYSPKDSTIRITAREDGEAVHISVLDEGPGIPEHDLTRVFDKFYRTSAKLPDAPGFGLGLAICRGFVTVMHGTIEAGNRNDRTGAIFTITLPRANQFELSEDELR